MGVPVLRPDHDDAGVWREPGEVVHDAAGHHLGVDVEAGVAVSPLGQTTIQPTRSVHVAAGTDRHHPQRGVS